MLLTKHASYYLQNNRVKMQSKKSVFEKIKRPYLHSPDCSHSLCEFPLMEYCLKAVQNNFASTKYKCLC